MFLFLLENNAPRHAHRANRFGNAFYNTFCTNVLQDGICPQESVKAGTEIMNIIDTGKFMFDTITTESELVTRIKEILDNITSIEITQEGAQQFIKTVVEDVSQSNIDYFMTKYSNTYDTSVKHATNVITITIVSTVLCVGVFSISCLYLFSKYFLLKKNDPAPPLL